MGTGRIGTDILVLHQTQSTMNYETSIEKANKLWINALFNCDQ